MNYLSLLTEDEIQYICSVIPAQDAVSYFKHNPKEFAKIRPGFRTTASVISRLNISSILFSYKSRGFISFFIEKHIDDWLKQIQKHYENCLKDGDSEELALLHTLPICFFAGNIGLYFKLTEKEYSDEFIALLSAAVNEIKEGTENQEYQSEKLKAKDLIIDELSSKLESYQSDLVIAKEKVRQMTDEIKSLNLKNTELERFEVANQKSEQEISQLKNSIQEQNKIITNLTTELSGIEKSRQLLEEQIREEIQTQQAFKEHEYSIATPKCPGDMDEFKEYLGYNLKNIGVPADADYLPLLLAFLSKTLFQGTPILINRTTGINLMTCVSNALLGQPKVEFLNYSDSVTNDDIANFLSSCERITCLDNFIGNFNETELLTLLGNCQNKIIFLTVAYDRTLCYIPQGFLKYCQYINLNRIGALSVKSSLSEDPSTLTEVDCDYRGAFLENRFSSILRDVLRELGIERGLIEQKCATILDEHDLIQILAFDALPYCVDVLKIRPFNTSERLLKYAGDKGRCPNKDLFKRWFIP